MECFFLAKITDSGKAATRWRHEVTKIWYSGTMVPDKKRQ